MSKRVSANKAGHIYATQYQKDVFEQKEADKMKHVIKMTKIIRGRRGDCVTFAKAVLIAKRAYKMGVRV